MVTGLLCVIAIPEVKGRIGSSFEIPIIIDKTENLAGVKLSIKYDKSILKYVNTGSKKIIDITEAQLMNDKLKNIKFFKSSYNFYVYR
jgi:hypothetical protein